MDYTSFPEDCNIVFPATLRAYAISSSGSGLSWPSDKSTTYAATLAEERVAAATPDS
jgi:hypothetical protein